MVDDKERKKHQQIQPLSRYREGRRSKTRDEPKRARNQHARVQLVAGFRTKTDLSVIKSTAR